MFDTLKQTALEYLNASSIHGMQYLNHGWNFMEKAMWLIAMIISLSCAGLLIQQGWQEAADDPLLVTLTTVPIDKVPFPAITISADNNGIYPTGFEERMLNTLAFHDGWDQSVYHDSMELRKYFKPAIDAYFDLLESSFSEVSLDRMKAYIKEDSELSLCDYDESIQRVIRKLTSLVAKAGKDSSYQNVLANVSSEMSYIGREIWFKQSASTFCNALKAFTEAVIKILEENMSFEDCDVMTTKCNNYDRE